MIWPFLFAVLMIVFTWKSVYRRGEDFVDHVLGTVILVLFAAMGFGVGAGFASLIGLAVPKHWAGPEEVQLVSLRDVGGANGHFLLGTGNIGTTQYYFFYKEAGTGYQPGKVAVADNVVIYEEKQEGGKLRTYTYRFMNPSFDLIAMDWQSQKYEFLIPEGSLKRNFVLQ